MMHKILGANKNKKIPSSKKKSSYTWKLMVKDIKDGNTNNKLKVVKMN